MDWPIVRALILCGMFAVLSYQDLRTRMTDDRVLIVFGGAGAVVYLADWELFDMTHVAMVVISSLLGGFLAWRLALFGTGDILALIAATIIFPLFQNIPIMIPLILASVMMSVIYTAVVNISYNMSDLLRGRLFVGIHDGPLRKVVAFFILHRQRNRPRYVFQAQEIKDGETHLRLRQPRMDADWASEKGVGKDYVSFPAPLMPFFFITMLVPLLIVL